jgi:2-amino-4-hydroxy-6-hydroxymethyldihydropteridine diphosphokinase
MDAVQVIAYIGLGSNLAEPIQQIKTARLAIANIDHVEERAFSSLYRSAPMGPQNQPDYINAVMAITTELPALDLLRQLQAIEKQQGRVRKGERWSARTLDLDLLIYGEQQIQTPDLTVPHAGLAERAFVLYPLQEVSADLEVPGLGKLDRLLAKCPLQGLQRLS